MMMVWLIWRSNLKNCFRPQRRRRPRRPPQDVQPLLAQPPPDVRPPLDVQPPRRPPRRPQRHQHRITVGTMPHPAPKIHTVQRSTHPRKKLSKSHRLRPPNTIMLRSMHLSPLPQPPRNLAQSTHTTTTFTSPPAPPEHRIHRTVRPAPPPQPNPRKVHSFSVTISQHHRPLPTLHHHTRRRPRRTRRAAVHSPNPLAIPYSTSTWIGWRPPPRVRTTSRTLPSTLRRPRQSPGIRTIWSAPIAKRRAAVVE